VTLPEGGLDPDPIPISLVAQFDYCPRCAWLDAAGEKPDAVQMAIGSVAHAPTDDPRTGRASVIRAVDVVHREWGYSGRCDTLEKNDDGSYHVVEYKATPISRHSTDVTRPMRTQLTLQVAALRSMGEQVSGQSIYFTEHKRRVNVTLSAEDFDYARSLVERVRQCLDSASAPPPLEDDPKCTRCSHVGLCLPDERALAPVTRRIVVADPDSQVVHLSTLGSRASIRQGRLLVHKSGEQIASVPMERVQGVAVHGNIDLSGGLIRDLLWRGLTIVWCTGSGRVVGHATSSSSPNGAARKAQLAAAHAGRLDLARQVVAAKIANQATLLRRNGDAGRAVAVLRDLAKAATRAVSVPELLGVEGEAASQYFGAFSTMLRAPGVAFTTRTRRPAQDPVNSCLNYTYALLLGDCIRALRACGLDPHCGFLHSSGRNKPALALDLCEEFRAPLADSTVVRAFNNAELKPTDFRSTLGQVTLTEPARKSLIAAYERRVTTEFTHPTFGYKCTWRRAIEIQARLILGVLDGTQPRYLGVRTR
jgi:CRISPR-associated protein Cas1